MFFEFDSKKQSANLIKHGIDLRDAASIFSEVNRLDSLDTGNDYAEERRITIGVVENRIWVVVYIQRADAIRLLAARKSNEREQKRYHALYD